MLLGLLCPPCTATAQSTPIPDDLRVIQIAARDLLAKRLLADTAESAERAGAQAEHRLARAHLEARIADYDGKHETPLLLDGDALRVAFQSALRPDSFSGEVGKTVIRGDRGSTRRAEFVPATIADDEWHLTVLLLPDGDARKDDTTLTAFVESTWGAAAAREHAIVVAPAIDPELDLDASDSDPSARNPLSSLGAALRPLGEAIRTLPCDRQRLILDCTRGTSAFGLRLASYFPDRFAGVVLRWPTEDDRLRLEQLGSVPILLVRSEATAKACKSLHRQLNATSPGTCRIVTPPGEYPFTNDIGIAEWSRQQRRSLLAPNVVLAPAKGLFRRNRWISIEAMTEAEDRRSAPHLTASADPQTNRITIQTRGVKSFRLYVGPALVDVRDFTLVVNGKEEHVQLEPRLQFLLDNLIFRFDPGALFTARHTVNVP